MRKSGIVEERRENIFCRAAIAQCATHALRAVLACWQDVHVSHIFAEILGAIFVNLQIALPVGKEFC